MSSASLTAIGPHKVKKLLLVVSTYEPAVQWGSVKLKCVTDGGYERTPLIVRLDSHNVLNQIRDMVYSGSSNPKEVLDRHLRCRTPVGAGLDTIRWDEVAVMAANLVGRWQPQGEVVRTAPDDTVLGKGSPLMTVGVPGWVAQMIGREVYEGPTADEVRHIYRERAVTAVDQVLLTEAQARLLPVCRLGDWTPLVELLTGARVIGM